MEKLLDMLNVEDTQPVQIKIKHSLVNAKPGSRITKLLKGVLIKMNALKEDMIVSLIENIVSIQLEVLFVCVKKVTLVMLLVGVKMWMSVQMDFTIVLHMIQLTQKLLHWMEEQRFSMLDHITLQMERNTSLLLIYNRLEVVI